jgi:hypothetical protein
VYLFFLTAFKYLHKFGLWTKLDTSSNVSRACNYGQRSNYRSHLPRPWERYQEQNNNKIISPSTVQRDFQRIISETGKPGNSPKQARKFDRTGEGSDPDEKS